MIIIVGLGNPGEEYRNTRHNTGWLVLDALTKKLVISNWQLGKKQFKAEIIETERGKEKLILVKPHTFMNKSGEAIKFLTSNYKLSTTNLYIIHDDLDLPLGRLKIVKNRSSAGHKGVESIIKALASQDFVRFRVGTGVVKSSRFDREVRRAKLKVQSQADYVLGEFKGENKKLFEQEIERCAEAVLYALENGIERTMGKYNIVIPAKAGK